MKTPCSGGRPTGDWASQGRREGRSSWLAAWSPALSAACLRRLCAVAATALVAACGGGDGDSRDHRRAATARPGPEVTVYFSDDPGALVPEQRSGPAGAAPLDAAMPGPRPGPTGAGLIPALPAGTEVRATRRGG